MGVGSIVLIDRRLALVSWSEGWLVEETALSTFRPRLGKLVIAR